ncbi:MAG: metallophosphoesterase family protein [Promethearchaeota archaeon]
MKIEEYNEISTNNGVISLQNYKIFWFIQISDTHFLWYDNDKDKRFRKFLNETYKQINPLFIFHTGDIVHANNGLEQNQIEWENYRKALNDNNMNSSIYMDVIGNHDAANNPNFTYFLNYSMMGVSFNTTQYAFNHSFAFGNYAFIGLDTAKESYNIFEYGFKGFLNGKEIDWYENELEKYKDFDKIFVFGHNPLEYPPFYNIISDVGLSGKDFYELNEEYNVSFYLSGHIHENSFQYYDDLLQITTGNFDQGGGIYRIVSLDNNRLSTSIGYVGDWPQAIITNPPGEDYSLKELNTVDEKLRVLAWDPNGIKSVKWSLIDSRSNLPLINWRPLVRINSKDPLWEGNLSFDYCGNLLLKVKVEGDSGIIIKEIRYNLCATSINTPSLIVLFTLVMGSVALIFVGNHYIPKIHNEVKKRRERNLDKSFPT